MNKDGYPDNWNEIASRIKEKADHRCERCGHPDDLQSGHLLGVHHLDCDKTNCADWNLAALCQRCHLHFQHMALRQVYGLSCQGTMFGVNEDWLKPHLEGMEKALASA